MRRVCTLFALIAVALGSLQAQDKIDSLKGVLDGSLADTTRVRVLIELSNLNQYVNFTESQHYNDEALALAEKLDDPRMKVAAYQQKGTLLYNNGNYGTALHFDNLALEIDMTIRDSVNIARDFNNIGNDFYDLGEYDDAFHYFTQSHRIASKVRDTLKMLIAYHNVGRVFKELGQYDRALDHLNLARKMSIQQDDDEGIAFAYDEIGDVQLRMNSLDSARATLSNALRLARRHEVKELEPRIYVKLAMVFLKKRDYDLARAYYDSAYALNSLTNDRFAAAEVELGRGIVFTEEGQYEEALAKVESSLAVAKELNARVLEIKCFNQLSRLWELKGDYRKALGYYKNYKQLEDTLFSQEMQGKLLRDQVRFETESRDSRIAFLSELQVLQQEKLKKQEFIRNILVVVVSLAAILLVSVYRSGRRRRQINMLLMKHQEETERRSEELERLNQVKDKFFSIISHDLRSPINALSGLLDLLDKGAVTADELPKHIKELKARFNHTRTLLNNLLDWTLLQMDKLNLQASKINIYNIVEENIQLLSSVQSKDVTLTNEIPPDTVGYADSNTINLVIRNLMTNAIKFTNDGGEVKIKAKDAGNEWVIEVSDNGVGMTPDVLKMLFDKTAPYTTRGTANEKGTGLGLILCKEFVEKNGGRIWVESLEERGSKFYFTLPKNT